MDIATFIALCKAAKDARGELLAVAHKRLSHEEKKLLLAAAEPGETEGKFRIHGTDQSGPWLRAGDVECINPNDRARRVVCLEAFESLCKRGLVHHESGNLFTLTGSGFKEARMLQKKKGLKGYAIQI